MYFYILSWWSRCLTFSTYTTSEEPVGNTWTGKRHNPKLFGQNGNNFLRTLPPPGFVIRRLYTKSYYKKVHVLRGQFLTKKLSVPGGNFSNYFMIIIVFRPIVSFEISNSREIAYNIWKWISCYVITIFPSTNRVRKQFVRTFK